MKIFNLSDEINRIKRSGGRGKYFLLLIIPLAIFMLYCFTEIISDSSIHNISASGQLNNNCDLFSENSSEYYVVRFVDSDGTVIDEEYVLYGNSLSQIPTYNKDGYEFVRWNYPAYYNLPLNDIPIFDDINIPAETIEHRLIAINALGIEHIEASEVDTDELTEFVDQVKFEIDSYERNQ